MTGLLFALVLLVRSRPRRAAGDVALSEVRALLPSAASLTRAHDARGGYTVLDEQREKMGVAVRTLPEAESITGYAGPTDALVVFGSDGRIIGIRIRDSADTANHVADVADDREFMGILNGQTWEEAATFDVRQHDIDAVSGATLTSRALIDGVVFRLHPPSHRQQHAPRVGWQFVDVVIAVAMAGAGLIVWGGPRIRPGLRRWFALAVVIALGWGEGAFLSQTLLVGWATGDVPWRTAPALVLLCALALLAPITTGKNVYCHNLCPHGLLQDLVARLSPWRWHIRPGLRGWLLWGPRILLFTVVVAMLMNVPLDLADVEAFDAYRLSHAAVGSVIWAGASVLAALFVPRAYCRFGCPTGKLLEGLRRKRPQSDTRLGQSGS